MKQSLWLFDIDGVLTDLKQRKLSKEVMDIVQDKINAGDPVTFITGRSLAWIQDRIIPTLRLDGNRYLQLACSCEKGGVFASFNQSGDPIISIKESLKVHEKVQTEVRELVKSEFAKTMFYDPKLTMATVEAREDVPNEAFRNDQKILDKKLEEMIVSLGLSNSLKLDSAEIATDVESKNVSKNIGVAAILDWLGQNSTIPEHVYAFGDRKSDLDIGNFLHSKNLPSTFVFTGGKDLLKDEDFPFEIVVTSKLYDQGTLEFFSKT